MAPPSMPLVPALALSPAICLDTKTKAKITTRPESSATTILSNLEIFDSPAYAFTTTPTSEEPSDQKEDEDEDEDGDASPSTITSVSTPTTPRQYGIGRQVLRGSGSGRDFDFIGSSSKRLSASIKRDSTGMEKKESRLSFGPEPALDSKAENNGNVEQLDKPSVVDVGSNHDPTHTQARTQSPTLTPRRRVKSDDTNPNAGADVSSRTTHHEKRRESSHPEWTLFLGIPRNAAPPPLPVLLSTEEPNAIPDLAASTVLSTAPPAMTQRHSLLTTHLLAPTMTLRNRTKSDSALLASASAPASGGAEEHGGKSEVASKTETKQGEEDWTLSLPLVMPPTAILSASSAEALRASKHHSDAPSGSGSQPVVEEESQPRVGEVDTQDLVITVEDIDKGKQKRRQGQVPVRRSEEETEEDQDPLILRVPRIVRSCSSYPILSTTSTSPTHNVHNRIKKSSSTKWMGMGATSTPNLRKGVVSSCTLEEEVMFMLLGDSATEEDDNESQSKSQSKLSKKDLAKKKMATLDEDLARFNALLKNGNLSGTGSRPVSSIIESAVAAAAAAITTATTTPTTTTTKTKAVTLNSHPDPIPTPTSSSSPPPLRRKSTSSQTLPILKPVLKHVKSCQPFLESSDGGVVPSPPPSMGPVMRFPSSTGRGDLNFFDELGGGCSDGHGELFKPSRASLRLTKSAERIMGELGDDTLMALGLPVPPVPTTMSRPASASSRASPSPPPAAQQQQRTSRSNSLLMTTSTTQTPLLPFAHYNTKFASSSSTSNLKSKGSVGRSERSGSRGSVAPTMPFRAVSMGSMSITTAPVESTSGIFYFLFSFRYEICMTDWSI